MVPATNALHPRRSTSKLVVILAAAANNNVPRKDTVFGNRPLGKNVLLDNKNSNKNNNCFALGAPNELLLGLRGGGGMGSAILQGMIRNPILVLCKYNNNKPKRRRKNIFYVLMPFSCELMTLTHSFIILLFSLVVMIASSVLSVYQNSLKYSKQLQSAVQGFIVVYVFLGLLEWQTRKKEQAENAMVDDDDIVPSPASAET